MRRGLTSREKRGRGLKRGRWLSPSCREEEKKKLFPLSPFHVKAPEPEKEGKGMKRRKGDPFRGYRKKKKKREIRVRLAILVHWWTGRGKSPNRILLAARPEKGRRCHFFLQAVGEEKGTEGCVC